MADLSHITTIAFDLDDTLRHNQPDAQTVFHDHAATLGTFGREERRNAQRWAHQYWANSEDLLSDIDSLTYETEAFWVNYGRRHLQALGFDEEQSQAHSNTMHSHMRENFRPQNTVHPDVPLALSHLRAKGYLLGVLTNRSKPIHNEMRTLGLDLHFDFFTTAAQLGAFKPDKAIFERLLKFIGREAGEVMYVGDNYYADVLGARNAGLLPVLLDNHGIYNEPDCLVIRSITELTALLQPEVVR
jgi:putative hydrolase of the HAD superfamily